MIHLQMFGPRAIAEYAKFHENIELNFVKFQIGSFADTGTILQTIDFYRSILVFRNNGETVALKYQKKEDELTSDKMGAEAVEFKDATQFYIFHKWTCASKQTATCFDMARLGTLVHGVFVYKFLIIITDEAKKDDFSHFLFIEFRNISIN